MSRERWRETRRERRQRERKREMERKKFSAECPETFTLKKNKG